MLEYKGYRGKVEYLDDAHIYHGVILGISDVVTFQCTNAEEMEVAFHESIDDYLAFCEEQGEDPNLVRIVPVPTNNP